MKHETPTIRNRSCYLFVRFAKSLKSRLSPFVDAIFSVLEELLVISFNKPMPIGLDDRLHLYEVLGILVGYVYNTHEGLVQKILQVPMDQITEIIDKQLIKNDTPEKPFFTNLLSHLISCFGNFSKGFNNCTGTSLQFFKQATEIILRILIVLPKHEEIRAKVVFVLHRMIETMGAEVLACMPLACSILMNSPSIKDIGDFIKLIAQLINKFKPDQILAFLNQLLAPLLREVFLYLAQISKVSPGSEELRELNELRKTYITMIHAIATNNMAVVFSTPENQQLINQVVGHIFEACEDPESSMQKSAYIVLQKFLSVFGGTTPTSIAGFDNFIYSNFGKLLVKIPLKNNLDSNDANASLVLGEVIQLQKELLKAGGNGYLNYMQNVFLPSVACPPDLIAQYLSFLQAQQGEKKDLKAFYRFFLAHCRKNIQLLQ
eukprot:TRINITY_DN5477_c0_g1_i2.p1 TRINITY_DN5477_c0_g1~~TRINITY_DN5477_c0_g1_i2.p1  ORF type:complete len:433 (+),score=95.93 TRINITY_DN5477_c0_g1_i2:132-1430(+)